MAPLPRKASWRRADTITRSDGVGAVSMSSVSGQQSGSRDGLLTSSSSLVTYVSLTKPTSSTNSQLLSPTSTGVYTSSLPESSPAATSPSTTDTGTFPHSLGDTSLFIVQSTTSNFLSVPVSTVFNPILTTSVATSSLHSSLLPAVTTKPPPASIAADFLDIVSSSPLDAQDAAQISTSISSIPSSTPYSTSSAAGVTSSFLLPLTTALSNSPTETSSSLNKALSTEKTSMPAVASTPVDDTPLFTLTPSSTPDISTTDSGLLYMPTLHSSLSSPVLTGDYALSTGEGTEPTNKPDALVDPALSTTELSSTTTTSSIPATPTSTTVATTTTTPTPALTPTSTLPPNTISTLTPIPVSSTATASGEPIEITTASPGIPINESSPNNETIDVVSVSPTPTDVSSSTETTSISGGTTLATPVPFVTVLQGDGLQPDLSQLGSSVSALSTSFPVETGTTVTATAAITTSTPAAITPFVPIPTVPTTTQTPGISVSTMLAAPVPSVTALQGDGLQPDLSQLGSSDSAPFTSFLVETGTIVTTTPAITTTTPTGITASVPIPTVPTTTQTPSTSVGTTLATPVPSVTTLQGDGLQPDLSQLGSSVSALFTSFPVETGTTVTATAAVTTLTPTAITPSALVPTVPTATQTPSIGVGTTLATSAPSGIPLVDNGSQPDMSQPVPSGSIALIPAISPLMDLGTTAVTTTTAIMGPIPTAPTPSIVFVPVPSISGGVIALNDLTGGISLTTSLFKTNAVVVSYSPTVISGTLTSVPITRTIPTFEPTVVPVSSPAAKRSSVPIAAIAAATVAAVVLILILVGLCHRRRQHIRRASLPTFGFLRTPETQETEAAPHSRLPSLPPIRSTGGWNDPPVAASASAELAQNPFADQVPMIGEPSNASRLFVAPPLTRAIRSVSVPDPFADPPALVSTSEDELPSRLSKASSYDMRDPRASVTSSNVGCAM